MPSPATSGACEPGPARYRGVRVALSASASAVGGGSTARANASRSARRLHQGVGHIAGTGGRVARRGVGFVGEEASRSRGNAARGCGVDREAELGHHLGRRSLDRLAGDDRRHCDDRRRRAQRVAHTGHGEDRVDADERVGRADDDGGERRGRRAPRATDAGGAVSAPSKRSSETTGSARAGGRNSPGSRAPSVGLTRVRTGSSDIGSNRARMPSAAKCGDRRQRLAGSEPPGALDMRREIAVAEVEPGLAAEGLRAAMKVQVSPPRPQPSSGSA